MSLEPTKVVTQTSLTLSLVSGKTCLFCNYLVTNFSFQVAEILKDRLSWFRDCRCLDVASAIPTGNGGTIELVYMQVIVVMEIVLCSFLGDSYGLTSQHVL